MILGCGEVSGWPAVAMVALAVGLWALLLVLLWSIGR